MKRLAFLVLMALLAPLTARGQTESPQYFTIELKFGPYTPALDQTNGLNGKTPFSDMFGDPSQPAGAPPSSGLLSLVEVDYYFLKRFGSLGVGLSGGYYWKSAPGFQNVGTASNPQYCAVTSDGMGGRTYRANGNDVMASSCFSGDSNTFSMVPLSLLAVYRFDVLDKRFRIPLIPYIKAGLGYYVWWFGNSGSFVSQVNSFDPTSKTVSSQNAAGASAGFVLNPGIAVDLSALDPTAARAIDQEIGLNRVTAFIELHGAWVGSCCTSSMKLNLSDVTFTAGLGFDF